MTAENNRKLSMGERYADIVAEDRARVTVPGKAPEFTIIKRFKEGHVFLRENATQRIAIGDQSGYYDWSNEWEGRGAYSVRRCDDGVLYVDITRPVLVESRSRKYRDGYWISIPLLQPDGRATSTPACQAEAVYCVAVLEMGLAGDDQPYLSTIKHLAEDYRAGGTK